MNKLLLFVLSSISITAFTQNHPLFVSSGAKSLALANTSVTQQDIWSNFNNQAGLSGLKQSEIGLLYENRFFNTGLNTVGFVGGIHTKSGVFGVSYKRFGLSDLFNQSIASVNYGLKLSDVFAVGGGISYLNTFIGNNYGKSGSFSAGLGVLAALNEQLTFGAQLSNINRAKVDDFNNERYPTLLTVGLNYVLSEKVETIVEVGKDITQKPSFRGAINYKAIEHLAVRIGAATNPTLFSFGIGYSQNNFMVDYGASFHQVLGLTNSISLSYSFGK